MTSTVERVQTALAELKRGNGRRYSPELQRQVAEAATELWRAGTGWCSVAKTLGVPLETIRRFSITTGVDAGATDRRRKRGRARRALVPVKVVDTAPRTGKLTVVSPSGHEVRGLDVAEAAELLQRLR